MTLRISSVLFFILEIIFSFSWSFNVFFILRISGILYFELELNDNDQAQAEKKVDDMCKKLLANLIIEDYKINKI